MIPSVRLVTRRCENWIPPIRDDEISAPIAHSPPASQSMEMHRDYEMFDIDTECNKRTSHAMCNGRSSLLILLNITILVAYLTLAHPAQPRWSPTCGSGSLGSPMVTPLSSRPG